MVTYRSLPTVVGQIQNEINRLFGRQMGMMEGDDVSNVATSQWLPAVDIKEETDKFVIVADVPGVESKDVQVSMENGMLTVKGERETSKEEQKAGYLRTERSYGSFYRRFSLPDNVDADNILAKMNNGVLTIHLPKTAKSQTRQIDINVE